MAIQKPEGGSVSAVIDVADLRKHFGQGRALAGLDLPVSEGQILGFLGPNGAGKSTTIRVLLGVLRATSGKAELFGRHPWRDAVRMHRDIACVPGDVTLWPPLTGGEIIDPLARMRGGIGEHRRNELIQRFDLDPKKKARTYSKGNRPVNATWYDTALGLALVFGRCLPMIFVLALAGSLAWQGTTPGSLGTLSTHRPQFVGIVAAVTVFLVALTFSPALALGPLDEGIR
jgi:energy-coupling factor transporter ATP-binding protein EcfA2